MRVFALSDIHTDYQENHSWLASLSYTEYQEDTLVLAGDVSYDLQRVKKTLAFLKTRFNDVFFVPGNHDLWIRSSPFVDSLDKFWRLLEACQLLDVHTNPARVGADNPYKSVWIVPLFSWYVTPEESGNSLFLPRKGIDLTRYVWADNYYTKWPSLGESTAVAHYFMQMNEVHLYRQYDAPVISFSHFLPRQELIFGAEKKEEEHVALKKRKRWFNFSRVAGSTRLEEQIRQMGSQIHVYGHQHRNRQRLIDSVLYVSHCLGYPRERKSGIIRSMENGPKCIWDSDA
jgi:predicted phosphodiesterase